MIFVGNDIVDLQSDSVGNKHEDLRFLRRVFTEEERRKIELNDNPEIALWMHWAAKEAAYKVVCKLQKPRPVFAHAQFVVDFKSSEDFGLFSNIVHATVRFRAVVLEVQFEVGQDFIHAIAYYPFGEGLNAFAILSGKRVTSSADLSLWDDDKWLQSNFTENELLSCVRSESALVRYFTKQAIGKHLEFDDSRVQIIRSQIPDNFQPPYLLIDGRRTEMDVSLSHHERFVAWSFSVRRAGEIG
ncbi:MAG: 4'-phosphopantetheinyl transferase superfamily protein [Deferribacteres bacterium]|nr:4'-phosphopantetheinyl transferase superfamily protein [candidate division KSB1 bacterium]MCB9500914.1 4'-phosphopantetheinyl transferase superfamily protein [Deferribacteres bacterium]